MTNKAVSDVAGVAEMTVLRYREKIAKRTNNVSSETSKTRVNKRGERRPAKYKTKRKKKKSEPTPQLPPDPPIKQPTPEEIGLPPPELINEPHPDHPGLTYGQVFTRQHGYVQVMPLAEKQRQQAEAGGIRSRALRHGTNRSTAAATSDQNTLRRARRSWLRWRGCTRSSRGCPGRTGRRCRTNRSLVSTLPPFLITIGFPYLD